MFHESIPGPRKSIGLVRVPVIPRRLWLRRQDRLVGELHWLRGRPSSLVCFESRTHLCEQNTYRSRHRLLEAARAPTLGDLRRGVRLERRRQTIPPELPALIFPQSHPPLSLFLRPPLFVFLRRSGLTTFIPSPRPTKPFLSSPPFLTIPSTPPPPNVSLQFACALSFVRL